MADTEVLHVRINGELRRSVNEILEELGLTESDAVRLLYKQIELNNGLPFDIKIPERLSKEKKLLEELKKSEDSIEQQGTIPIEEIRAKYK